MDLSAGDGRFAGFSAVECVVTIAALGVFLQSKVVERLPRCILTISGRGLRFVPHRLWHWFSSRFGFRRSFRSGDLRLSPCSRASYAGLFSTG
jgi:hypothetical protein